MLPLQPLSVSSCNAHLRQKDFVTCEVTAVREPSFQVMVIMTDFVQHCFLKFFFYLTTRLMQACVDVAFPYAHLREAFGKTIGEHQVSSSRYRYLFAPSSACLSVRPSVCLSISLSVCLSVCLSVYLSVYLSVCLCACPSVSINSMVRFVTQHTTVTSHSRRSNKLLITSICMVRLGCLRCDQLVSFSGSAMLNVQITVITPTGGLDMEWY